MTQTFAPTPYFPPEPKRPTSVLGLIREHSRTAALFMAVALPVPIAAFSGMAIPLPPAIERIAAALVSGQTLIASDVDVAAAEALQAAQANQIELAYTEDVALVVSDLIPAPADEPLSGAEVPDASAASTAGDERPGLTITLASANDPIQGIQFARNVVGSESDPGGATPTPSATNDDDGTDPGDLPPPTALADTRPTP